MNISKCSICGTIPFISCKTLSSGKKLFLINHETTGKCQTFLSNISLQYLIKNWNYEQVKLKSEISNPLKAWQEELRERKFWFDELPKGGA